MTFELAPDRLMPELTVRQELTMLARTLWRAGYDDHLAGHITINAGDGTLWCNPWLVRWDELVPSQVIRIDLGGEVVEGEWPAPLGIPLHLELHRARPDVQVTVHNHPLYGVVWADLGEVPPILDQSSALGGGGELVLVDEYDGAVNDAGAAASAVDAIGAADLALLAAHGVLVIGSTVRVAFQRAVALEQRCQRAWHVRAAAVDRWPVESRVAPDFLAAISRSDGNGFIGFWEAAVRAELRADPDVLDR